MSHKNQIEIYQFNSRAKYWLVRAEGGKYACRFADNRLTPHTRKNYRALQATNSTSVSRQKSIKTPNYIYC